MHESKNGYVGGAILFRKIIKNARDHVEFEKFLCRVVVDNETTREFKSTTDQHENKLHKYRYNSEKSNNLTKAGRDAIKQQSS